MKNPCYYSSSSWEWKMQARFSNRQNTWKGLLFNSTKSRRSDWRHPLEARPLSVAISRARDLITCAELPSSSSAYQRIDRSLEWCGCLSQRSLVVCQERPSRWVAFTIKPRCSSLLFLCFFFPVVSSFPRPDTEELLVVTQKSMVLACRLMVIYYAKGKRWRWGEETGVEGSGRVGRGAGVKAEKEVEKTGEKKSKV